MDMLTKAAEKVMKAARVKGVEAEAFLLRQRELSIDVIDGQVETLKEAEELGLGIRVVKGGQLGFAYSSDLSDLAIREAVDDAVSISHYTAADEHNVLPRGAFSYPRMELYDDDINSASLEEKIELARTVEQAARASDDRIRIIERAGYEDGEFTTLIVNTHGLFASGRANFSGLYIFLVAEEDNDAQNGFGFMTRKKIKDLSPEAVGKEAAGRALRSLNARPVKSARMPCIIEPYVAIKFLGLLAQSANAEAAQKGKSMWKDREGQQVASYKFSLVDDPTYQEGIAAFPFDGEGVPGRRNSLVEDGVLKTLLYDTYTASKAGVQSTGNGKRGSFRSLPSVGTSNFILLGGKNSPDQLRSEIEKGFYVTEVMGMHTANPISGDFSLGASGLMIENGQLTYPVRGVTIAGNMVNFLKDIEDVGNDLRFFGSRAAPTLRLRSLSVAGE